MLNDGVNQYLYDGEERICAVKSATGAMTGYIYDAAGDRFAKGTITTFSCNLSSNGFATTSGYVVGLNGEQLTETTGGTGWLHTHVFANGKLLATYSSSDTLFELNDWLGTRRADAGVSGCLTTWLSLPYGNALSGTGNCSDSSELHFTGKERDTESGNDYFAARYYASTMGRFMSPDDVGGHLEDPQSLNLYSYVANNPLSRTDPTGHDFWQSCATASNTCGEWKIGTDANGKDINQLVSGTTSNGKFSATVITSASLGQAGSGNTAAVNGNGVMITTGTGTSNQQTGQGIFIAHTPAADIQGQGAGWNQFSFHIDSSDIAHGVLTSGKATYNGTGGHQGMLDTLNNMTAGGHGPWQYKFEDYYNFNHWPDHNIRFSTGADPRDVNYGPSPHFPVPSSGTSVPDFHVDSITGSQHVNCAVRGTGCF